MEIQGNDEKYIINDLHTMETVSNTATDRTKNKYDGKAFREILAFDPKTSQRRWNYHADTINYDTRSHK